MILTSILKTSINKIWKNGILFFNEISEMGWEILEYIYFINSVNLNQDKFQINHINCEGGKRLLDSIIYYSKIHV